MVNVDTVPPAAENCPFVQADLTDFGQALEVLSEVDDRLRDIDALVHLAAIPAPGRNPNAVIFKVNTLVGRAGVIAVGRVMGLSSPVSEEHPCPAAM